MGAPVQPSRVHVCGSHIPEYAEYLRTQRNDGCLGEGTELLDNGVAPCGTSRILYHVHLLVKIILRISKKKAQEQHCSFSPTSEAFDMFCSHILFSAVSFQLYLGAQ